MLYLILQWLLCYFSATIYESCVIRVWFCSSSLSVISLTVHEIVSPYFIPFTCSQLLLTAPITRSHVLNSRNDTARKETWNTHGTDMIVTAAALFSSIPVTTSHTLSRILIYWPAVTTFLQYWSSDKLPVLPWHVTVLTACYVVKKLHFESFRLSFHCSAIQGNVDYRELFGET